MKKILSIILIFFSTLSYSQIIFNSINNSNDIFSNKRLYSFSKHLGVDICNYEILSINKIVFITDSLESEGYYIQINSKKFYGNNETNFTAKKKELNINSYKKINKKYLFCYYNDDFAYFYYIE